MMANNNIKSSVRTSIVLGLIRKEPKVLWDLRELCSLQVQTFGGNGATSDAKRPYTQASTHLERDVL